MGGALAISLFIGIVTYITSFKDDFKSEELEKVAPFIIISGVIILVFQVLAYL